ncbi:hypothetical protein L1887_13147 [Cichorium endivia]|nr:hypothetical protein L1887_13147 [Cichorium endivia]
MRSHVSIENCKKIEPLQPADIGFTIEKKVVVTSLWNNWNQIQDFDKLLVDQSAIDGVINGFIVKKMQRGSDHKYVEEILIDSRYSSPTQFKEETPTQFS